jgi:cell division protein FtsQ
MMPMSRSGECHVLVAGGDFTEPLRIDSLNSQTAALVKLATWLDDERRYRGMIDQIYVERDGDMMMVPKLGNHVVELGSVDNLDEKFENLLTFYRNGMPRAGWETYSKISLKYHGQVVCTKR